MLKNPFQKTKFPCSECGSINTELSKKPLSQLSKAEKMLGLHTVKDKPPFLGQVFVCCKDCNHEAIVNMM